MVTVSRKETALDSSTIAQLIDTTITKNNQKQKLTQNIESDQSLKEMNQTMKIIKEQNDDMLGDVY